MHPALAAKARRTSCPGQLAAWLVYHAETLFADGRPAENTTLVLWGDGSALQRCVCAAHVLPWPPSGPESLTDGWGRLACLRAVLSCPGGQGWAARGSPVVCTACCCACWWLDLCSSVVHAWCLGVQAARMVLRTRCPVGAVAHLMLVHLWEPSVSAQFVRGQLGLFGVLALSCCALHRSALS